MGRTTALGLAFAISALAFYVACGSDGGTDGNTLTGDSGAPHEDGSVNASADAGGTDGSDPRCGTQAVLLGTHPHAIQQPSDLGKIISDVRGFHGSVYLAYGDLELNTGPIFITTFEPKTKTWTEHPVAYRQADGGPNTTPAFYTHDIERFVVAGDAIWAPAAQPDYNLPFNANSAPEYAVGTANHDWSQVDISPTGIHVIDTIERATGDIYMTGSAFIQTDAGDPINGRAGGHIWRSQDGGPFNMIFPDLSRPASSALVDLSGAFIYGAALNGTAYFDSNGYIYKFDGTSWDSWENFGEFVTPAPFAGHLVFSDLGQFFAFDGTKRINLNFRLFDGLGRRQGALDPPAMFQVTEGRVLAVNHEGNVMMTTDLTSWSCIGKVPPDATSVGSLDGIVYFGSVHSQIYGFPSASW